ncbi:dienelactone hydrolase [soil metagenome]
MNFKTVSKIPRAGWSAFALLSGLLSSICSGALAAGYERAEVPAAGADPAIQAMIWRPCELSPSKVPQGSDVRPGVENCAILGASLPLVVISHGQGGTLMGHHDTAEALADAGFVVVAFNHPGDSLGDDAMAQQLRVFESRPRDASRVISFMLQNWHLRQHLDGKSVGVFGFSRGGYTALALAGAGPNLPASAKRLCGDWWSLLVPLCRQSRSEAAILNPRADPQIHAAVVVDPLNLFNATGVQSVRVPVQLWASEQGGDGVALSHIEAIRSALPQAPEFHVAKGAGHFAYLAPCSPALKESARKICTDPEGFDRPAWHRSMNAAVVTFFKRQLHAPGE